MILILQSVGEHLQLVLGANLVHAADEGLLVHRVDPHLLVIPGFLGLGITSHRAAFHAPAIHVTGPVTRTEVAGDLGRHLIRLGRTITSHTHRLC